jgi:hypothetical protein
MRVLIACEYSGRVRDAFLARGHDAWSCDLLPTEVPGPHIQGDVLEVLADGWDLAICHPPCTHTAVSGARHFHRKAAEQAEALRFIRALWDAPIPRMCIEQPVSIAPRVLGPVTQTIQPYEYGTGETKRTCLFLRGLPKLRPTDVVPGRVPRVHRMPPGPDRWRERSRTYPGIAAAMAAQWGNPTPVQGALAFDAHGGRP